MSRNLTWRGGVGLAFVAMLLSAPLAPLPFAGAQPNGGVAEASRWRLSEEDSLLYVQVFRDESRLAAGASHNHVIRAGSFDGSLRFDPDRPSACALSMTIPVVELVVDEPWLRERVGYEQQLSGSDRHDVRRSMLDDDQLGRRRYPNITVAAEGCERLGSERYRADVTVTIRGRSVTRPTTLRTELTDDGRRLRVRGRFTVRHADFGMEPYSAWLGAVANAEPIRFVADLVATA